MLPVTTWHVDVNETAPPSPTRLIPLKSVTVRAVGGCKGTNGTVAWGSTFLFLSLAAPLREGRGKKEKKRRQGEGMGNGLISRSGTDRSGLV